MKRSRNLCLILMAAMLMSGCGEKFEPTESTVFVDSKGAVKGAIMESFDKAYYKFDELSEEVEKEVREYCLDKNDEAVTVESLTQEGETVTLLMDYESAEDYAEFNDVVFFSGTYGDALDLGYLPEELYDTKGQIVDRESEELEDLRVIITEESISVQTSGKIRYISDNVSLTDKKLAKVMEAGKTRPAFILYK